MPGAVGHFKALALATLSLPRLIAAGADPKRVYFVNSARVGGEDKSFSLVSDLQLLRQAIDVQD
jgi:hypothetical protein